MTEIKLPPLPEARIVSYQTDSTMRSMELRTYCDEDMQAYATAAIEADRQARGEPVAWAELHPRTGDVCDFIRKDEAYRLDEIKPEYVLPLYATPQSLQQETHSRQDSHDKDDPSGADGYAYRYRHINGGTVLRFNHGEEVNGSKPIEAVPYWFAPVSVPSDEEIGQVLDEVRRNSLYGEHHWGLWLEFARALLAKYGNHPTRRNPDAL